MEIWIEGTKKPMRSETNLEVRSNCALDLLRLVCAVAVVFIHSAPGFYGAAGQSINGALHVPPLVFFLISGYFWRDARGETSRERRRRRFVKTLKVTVFWVVAYMLFTTALVYPFHGELPGMDSAGEWLRSFFSADNLVKMVLVQRSPGVGTHLWYMLALTVAQLAMWGLYEIKATRARLPLAVALIAAQIAVQWTFCLKGWNFGAEFLRNAWLTGLPWMLVGDWLRGREESIRRIPTALLAAVGVLGLFTAPLEFWWGGTAEYPLGLYFAAPALVMLAVKLGTNVDRPWARPVRAFTQPLYLWHMLFVMPMKTAITALSLNGNLWWLIMPVTVLLCLGVFQLKRRLLARRARS